MMPTLPSELRSLFENEVVTARDAAEKAAEAALATLAINQDRPFEAMTEAQRELRRVLRARARQLGGGEQVEGMPRLIEEIAYEQWHRLLFSRFLAENNLLMHPDWEVAVSLEECEELAPEMGVEDRWEVAARFAVAMLPGIFNFDDPALQVRFAPEYRQWLEQIVSVLPKLVFTADDSLGWAYQFWQSKKKKEINNSERKIGGAEIGPVTQLFTEDYMVKFLLHNSLGAWWAARHPDSPLLKDFEYLRYREDGTPAAGTFDGWPDRAAEVTVMDPCCGSGHFLIAAFEMLTKMRMEEEGLDLAAAGDAVIKDNLFGLEIDPRCTQIAAFNLTLTVWKTGGYRILATPNIACSGIPVQGQLEDWVKLAGNEEVLKRTIERLYHLFRNASDLGSLIDPAYIPKEDRMFLRGYQKIESLLEKALQSADSIDDPAVLLFGGTVKGIVRATQYLTKQYILVTTNVPYLGFKKQGEILGAFCESHFPDSKMDLSSVFVERCRELTEYGGAYALVTLQNWLFLGSYDRIRFKLLSQQHWHLLSWLGPGAFRTISGEVVKPALIVCTNDKPPSGNTIFGIDASNQNAIDKKAKYLKEGKLKESLQSSQLNHPDFRITLDELGVGKLLDKFAYSPRGIVTGDSPYWIRYFWELPRITQKWRFLQSTVSSTVPYGGREQIINWETNGDGMLRPGLDNPSYGKRGVAISQTGDLPCTLYTGDLYDNNCAALVPKNQNHLPALWEFCKSPMFNEAVRKIDKKRNVTNATFLKIPFDLDYWQQVAEENGFFPEPYSNDPTQWLFTGSPVDSKEPLQVSVARLSGYQWPNQEADPLITLRDEDGILCLPSVAGEAGAADWLRSFLAEAYGNRWTPELYRQLLKTVGFEGKELEEWLLDGFFDQHCKLFLNRPFIWQIWDGRKDGFSALVNYHKLDHAKLERLIYTYLGDWIRTQKAELEQNVPGAEGRLVAALKLKNKLELILEGDSPYDIYVRWKELHEQPIGWNPDLTDGVRLNIRPFVEAGVLRSRFTINWGTDRGTNPDGSRRRNDLHFTRAEKEADRARAR